MSINNVPATEPDRQYHYMNLLHELVFDMTTKRGKAPTFTVTTFGCQMNAHDSEKLKGILCSAGFEEASEEGLADLTILNTCTVRENANQKLYGHLGSLKSVKREHPDMMIGLCGCMMQESHVIETIKSKYKHVDLVFGTHNIYKLAELLYRRLTEGGPVIEILDSTDTIVEALPQKRKYDFKAGVNIMYGCNNFCTYCIVPYVRGREKSRSREEILAEVKALADDGAKEFMLLGQNVNSYAYDFPGLLREVCHVPGVERVRFMTSHPKDLSDELIDVIASEEKIARHIHLPIQSGSTRLLKKMNRVYTKESYLALVDKIRAKIPDISITTDIIVGFPGETEEDHAETMDVCEKVRYDQAFTFIYSKRTGTPAADFPDQVPPEVVKERFDRLLTRINQIAAERTERFKGQTKSVLVEEVNRQDAGYVTGRTSENLTVHFPGDASMIGSFVDVKLLEPKGFYYMGEI